MKPIQIFLFLVAVGVLCALTVLYFPKDGVKIGEHFTLTFASPEDFNSSEEERIQDVEAFLQSYEIGVDSTAIYDSIEKAKIAYRQAMLKIQWPDTGETNFERFTASLLEVKQGTKKKVRIMHYGDSQIEGDRITSFIRDDMQKAYGGEGPGLLPVIMAVPTSAITQVNSDNWERFTLFGKRDTNITHSRYAPLGSFGMYEYPIKDSLEKDTAKLIASMEFSVNNLAKYKTRRYREVKMFYGYADSTTLLKSFVDDSLFDTRNISSPEGRAIESWTFDHDPEKFRLEFESERSPEFYAFSFESKRGVIVDNIAMRGSSGTLFKKMDHRQLSSFITKENVELFILQYGGNSVPYVKDAAQAEKYGRWFSSQIAYLKRLKPKACFIVIGPSDMSTKVGANFVSYPFLEEVRDALKKAAFENGAGFWDLFEVMGGRNSMISWVESDPPLAGGDYVHFTYRGTKRVSELFLKALWQDINKRNESEELVE